MSVTEFMFVQGEFQCVDLSFFFCSLIIRKVPAELPDLGTESSNHRHYPAAPLCCFCLPLLLHIYPLSSLKGQMINIMILDFGFYLACF